MTHTLTQIQRDIVKCVLHRASFSIDEISKIVPHKPHVIRRCLEQLQESKLIRKSILCNFYRLGYSCHNMHFSVRGNKANSIPDLLDYLVGHPKVSWCAQSSGDFDYEISVLSRDRRGVTDLLRSISDTFGDIIEKKQLVAEYSHNFFGYKYISDLPIYVPTISFEESADNYQIDQLDATLMKVLSTYGEVPLSEVARKIGIPVNKLSYRKQRLVQRGLLLGDVYFLDRTAIIPVTLSAFINVSNHDTKFRSEFMSFCAAHPNVWCCNGCLGAWDYRVAIYADTLAAAMAALDQLKARFGAKMLSIATTTPLRELKLNYFPFDASTLSTASERVELKVA